MGIPEIELRVESTDILFIVTGWTFNECFNIRYPEYRLRNILSTQLSIDRLIYTLGATFKNFKVETAIVECAKNLNWNKDFGIIVKLQDAIEHATTIDSIGMIMVTNTLT